MCECRHVVENLNHKDDKCAAANMNKDELTVQSPNAANSSQNAELIVLRKKHEMLKLKQEIREMEAAENSTAVSVKSNPSLLNRNDLFREFRVAKFTGEEPSDDVNDFFASFERVASLAMVTGTDKLFALHRLLDGAAATLLSQTEAMDYGKLKRLLVNIFGEGLPPVDAGRALRERTWEANESWVNYIYEMDQLADRMGQSKLNETELVAIMIDNMKLPDGEETLLSDAKTVVELKKQAAANNARNNAAHVLCSTDKKPGKTIPAADQSNVIPSAGQELPFRTMRIARIARPITQKPIEHCENCNGPAHDISKCPLPLKTCYKCFKQGHWGEECDYQY